VRNITDAIIINGYSNIVKTVSTLAKLRKDANPYKAE